MEIAQVRDFFIKNKKRFFIGGIALLVFFLSFQYSFAADTTTGGTTLIDIADGGLK